MTTSNNTLTEDQIKLIILENNNNITKHNNAEFQKLFTAITRMETNQGNYLDFMRIITGENRDIDVRLRNLEEMRGQMETLNKVAENIQTMSNSLSKLENVPERLDQVVTKEEFEKTVTGIQNQIKSINEEHNKNTELRKNLAFLFLAIIVLVPIITKLFEMVNKS